MRKINCIIVDDEPLSQDVLKKYIGEVNGLFLVTCCFNALDAITILRENSIDLIFLDINMPKLTGINFIKSLEKPPMVIFTTAYPQYAVEGFDLDAVDYLVKPISFERFLKSVNKAFEILNRVNQQDRQEQEEFMTIKSDKKIYKINYSEILFFQAYGDFVKVHFNDKIMITAETMKNLERFLPAQFMRVHKSYIIALNRIKYLEGNIARLEDHDIPISPNFREMLINRLNPPSKKDDK